MKYLIVLVALFSSAAMAQTHYNDIDDSTLVDTGGGSVGWGSCVSCAGGGNNNATIASSPNQTRPSKDGASRDFYINGAAYSDGLWWYKVGANDAVSNFSFDFWLNVASNTQGAQAMEFDTFQFVNNQQYMFGTQCNYASGTWDLWNAGAGRWVHTSISCRQFSANNWYHLTFAFHRTSDGMEHYDSLVLEQYNGSGRLRSRNTYTFNQAYPSAALPQGWSENMGVQFQMDIAGTGTSMQEWVDEVSLTAW